MENILEAYHISAADKANHKQSYRRIHFPLGFNILQINNRKTQVENTFMGNFSHRVKLKPFCVFVLYNYWVVHFRATLWLTMI